MGPEILVLLKLLSYIVPQVIALYSTSQVAGVIFLTLAVLTIYFYAKMRVDAMSKIARLLPLDAYGLNCDNCGFKKARRWRSGFKCEKTDKNIELVDKCELHSEYENRKRKVSELIVLEEKQS